MDINNKLQATGICCHMMGLVAQIHFIVAASSLYSGLKLRLGCETMDKEADAFRSRVGGLPDTVSLMIQRIMQDSSTNFDINRPKGPRIWPSEVDFRCPLDVLTGTAQMLGAVPKLLGAVCGFSVLHFS